MKNVLLEKYIRIFIEKETNQLGVRGIILFKLKNQSKMKNFY